MDLEQSVDRAVEASRALDVDQSFEGNGTFAPIRERFLIDKHFIQRLEELEAMWREATEECEWGLENYDMDHYNRFQTKRNEATGRIVGCIQAMLPHVEEV